METVKTRLLNRLKELDQDRLLDLHVTLLPDFFIDHLITLGEFENISNKIKDVYNQGGGNLPGFEQRIHQGGNAANTALALARLGVKSHLICRTNEFGLHLLKYFLGRHGVDLSGVKTDGKLAATAALEFGENRTNVMIGDTGSVSDFSFDVLDDKDLSVISNSDIVSVLNWNLNKMGTGLAREMFRFAKKHSKKTFFDTGDPSPRKDEISTLIDTVLTDKNLDVLGLNENELLHYTSINNISDEELIKAAISLKKKMHARVDLHTTDFACTVNTKPVVAPSLKLSKIYRSTGAGDTWNAGNIFGELLGFDDEERLLFANSSAAYYISSPEPIPPALNDVIEFIGNYAFT